MEWSESIWRRFLRNIIVKIFDDGLSLDRSSCGCYDNLCRQGSLYHMIYDMMVTWSVCINSIFFPRSVRKLCNFCINVWGTYAREKKNVLLELLSWRYRKILCQSFPTILHHIITLDCVSCNYFFLHKSNSFLFCVCFSTLIQSFSYPLFVEVMYFCTFLSFQTFSYKTFINIEHIHVYNILHVCAMSVL